jgi:hypothetical protein
LKVTITILAAIVSLPLMLISVPWVFYGLGCAMMGDDDRWDASMDSSPIGRYFDWIQERSR